MPDRRAFLKTVGVTAAALALPLPKALAKREKHHFQKEIDYAASPAGDGIVERWVLKVPDDVTFVLRDGVTVRSCLFYGGPNRKKPFFSGGDETSLVTHCTFVTYGKSEEEWEKWWGPFGNMALLYPGLTPESAGLA